MKNLQLTLLVPLITLAACAHYTEGLFTHVTLPSKGNNYAGEFGILSGRIGERAVANVSCENYYGVLVPPTLTKSTEDIKYYKYQCNGTKPLTSVIAQSSVSNWCASKGAYTNEQCPPEPAQYAASTNTTPSAPSGISYFHCKSMNKILVEGKESCPAVGVESAGIENQGQAVTQKDTVRDLKERLREAEAKEALDRRNRALEARQIAIKDAAEKLAQKQADVERRRAEKAESERLAADAKRGDGSKADLHCKTLKLAPTTPKYLTCRKDFEDSEELSRVAEQQRRREAEEAQLAAEQAKIGDGTPEHQVCLKFGFIGNTPPYADCRLRLEINKQEAAQRQAVYEEEKQRYERQLAAVKREKEREEGLALMRFGAALAGSTSPTFAGGLADANRAMGWGPAALPAPPTQPKLQQFMIQGPKGVTTCTVFGNTYNCF